MRSLTLYKPCATKKPLTQFSLKIKKKRKTNITEFFRAYCLTQSLRATQILKILLSKHQKSNAYSGYYIQ